MNSKFCSEDFSFSATANKVCKVQEEEAEPSNTSSHLCATC